MLVKAKCKICRQEGLFDIGDLTREQVEEKLSHMKSFQCSFGNHTEAIGPLELYDFDWDNLAEGQAPSEEDFLTSLKSQYSEVYTLEELQEIYEPESFLYGMCMCHPKKDPDEMAVFNLIRSPEGKRYYYR